MKYESIFFVIAALLTFSSLEGKSQPIISPSNATRPNQIFISIGLEPELVTTIGYTHLALSPGKNVDFHVGASVKLAPLIFSNGAWRFNIIGLTNWKISDTWKTRFTSKLYLAHDNNRAGEMHGFGSELQATLLHFGKTWAKGVDIGWQYTALTHIKHSEETKDTFNDRYSVGENGTNGPRDGWYRATARRFRLGFAGSRRIGDQWRVQLRIGALLSVQKQGILLGFSHAQVPFYINSTVSFNY